MATGSIPLDILKDLDAVAPYVTDNTAGEVASPATAAAGGVAGAVESATTAVPDFLSRLTSQNLWLRVLKVAAGLMLIITGLVQLTHLERVVGLAGRAAAVAA